MAEKVDVGPDPHPDCPRCNYFTNKPLRRLAGRSGGETVIYDQNAVDKILGTAFPQTKRRYG